MFEHAGNSASGHRVEATAPPIKNYPSVNNHTDNRHGIDGYLDDVQVAAQIFAALRGN